MVGTERNIQPNVRYEHKQRLPESFLAQRDHCQVPISVFSEGGFLPELKGGPVEFEWLSSCRQPEQAAPSDMISLCQSQTLSE